MNAALGVRFAVFERVVGVLLAVVRVVVRAVVLVRVPAAERVRVVAVAPARRRPAVVLVVLLPAAVVRRLFAVVFLVPLVVRVRVDRALTVLLFRLVPFAGMVLLL